MTRATSGIRMGKTIEKNHEAKLEHVGAVICKNNLFLAIHSGGSLNAAGIAATGVHVQGHFRDSTDITSARCQAPVLAGAFRGIFYVFNLLMWWNTLVCIILT